MVRFISEVAGILPKCRRHARAIFPQPREIKGVKGGVTRVTWPRNFCALNANSSKTAKDTNFKFGTHAHKKSPEWPLKIFEQGAWLGSRDPVNFWTLNANSSKTAKDTNFKFGTHAPTESPDITPEKKFEQGPWLGSRDPLNCWRSWKKHDRHNEATWSSMLNWPSIRTPHDQINAHERDYCYVDTRHLALVVLSFPKTRHKVHRLNHCTYTTILNWSKMAVGRHLGCEPTGSSAIRSAVPQNSAIESSTKLIGSPISEIWQLEISKMAAGRHLGFCWIWRLTKWFYFLWQTYSFILDIVHHNQLKKVQNSANVAVKIWFYAFWQQCRIFGRHLGFEAKSEVPRSVFQIVWFVVHESTEKTLTGKKGSFYLAWTWLHKQLKYLISLKSPGIKYLWCEIF